MIVFILSELVWVVLPCLGVAGHRQAVGVPMRR